MKKTILIFSGVLTMLLAWSCMPVEEEVLTEVNINVKNKAVQRLINFQDRQNTDSLLQYITHPDPTFRFYVANAFASHHDSTAIDTLATLLSDEIDQVRIAAAYALGQMKTTGAEKHLVGAFVNDSTGIAQRFNGTILESIGKSATPQYLEFLGTTSTYERKDTALLEGQALGIYRYALRKITHPAATRKMVDFVTEDKYPPSVRLIAANYLSRTTGIKLDTLGEKLAAVYKKEADPNIKMALAIAVGKTKSPPALETLIENFATERDYRVKTNIIRALKNFEYQAVQATVIAALEDKNRHVANAAAQFFIDNGVANDANYYRQKARDTLLHWSTQIKLKGAANKHLPYYFQEFKTALNWQLKQEFNNTQNSLKKIALLEALSAYGWNYNFFPESFNSSEAAIRSASVNGLANIVANPKFTRLFGGRQKMVTEAIKNSLVQAVKGGDVGMAAIAAGALRNETAGFKSILADTTVALLTSVQQELKLPKEIETYNEIQMTIDFLNGSKKSNVIKAENNHPINWRRINNLGENPKARVVCEQGEITIDLFPEQAPGSVANFIDLSKQGYYDGKKFHRVVSNFVIQGGCPRSDGYGGLDYTVRSELPNLYYNDGGYLGMASAGNHTECTQWFITHSPTPHLDGRYTILGKVSEGMDVIHKIFEGEVIKKVEILN